MTERRPDAARERSVGFRAALSRGEDTVDVATWAGALPAATGVAPRVRVGSRWFNLLWLLPLGFLLLLIGVAAAKGLRGMPSVQDFIARHPGTDLRADRRDYLGIPAWARWQHFFNVFFMLFILRSGLQILTDHPRLYWTRHSTPGRDWFRIQKPVPPDPLWTAKQDSISLPGQVGLPGIRHSIGLARWWHLGVNTLWLLNGLALLRPAVRDAPVEAPGAHELERLPRRARRQRSSTCRWTGRRRTAGWPTTACRCWPTSSPSSSPHRWRCSPGSACRRRCPPGSSGSAECSASRPPDHCTSWSSSGSCSSSSCT